ncbi:MAG: solute-binding protein [Blautia sp.]|nr:solute-binding protein [Blautia sp.]
MSNVRDKAGKIGLFLAGSIFHIAVLAFAVVLLFWLGKTAYEFGYEVFIDQPMSPDNGKEVTVIIDEGSSVLEIGKVLESKGLIKNPYVFVVQERISNYHGKILPGRHDLSTAYTPSWIIAKLAGEEDQEGTDDT